ncbi:MAG: AAA family ATPase [Pseudomonadota bacterium]
MGIELINGQFMVDAFLSLLPSSEIKNLPHTTISKGSVIQPEIINNLCSEVEKNEPLLWKGQWEKDEFNLTGYPSHSEGDMALAGAISRAAVGMQLPESMFNDAIVECFMRSAMYRSEKHNTFIKYTVPKVIASVVSPIGYGNTQPASIQGMTAAQLALKHFAPINWIVQDILPEGSYLLSARPKVGKSWLALQLCLAVAHGDPLWGKNVQSGTAIYLALEENFRRLQTRLSQLRQPFSSPHLMLHTSWKRSDQGGIKDLEDMLIDLKPRLVVIDTLAKFRPPSSKGASAYEGDYNALAPTTELANKYHCCILVVTHNRKGKSEGDAIEMVSGTLGQMGAVDGALIIDGSRGDSMMRLTLVGRDIEQDGEFAITKRPQGGWDWSGSASQAFVSAERQLILNLLGSANRGLKPIEVAERLDKPRGAVRKLMSTMAIEMQLKRDSTGTYSV